MEKLIQLYRSVVDSLSTPAWIKQIADKVAARGVKILYSNRHSLAHPYKLRAMGEPFWLFANWMDYSDGLILSKPIYEEETLKFIKKNLKAGQTFADIGSNIGYFPLAVASWRKDNQIISVEPFERNVNLQRAAVEKNGFKIKILQAALSDKSGEGEIKVKLLNSGSGSTVGYFGKNNISSFFISEKVEFISLEDFFLKLNLDQIDIMLMDIQGAEFSTLYAAQDLIKSGKIKTMIIEHTDTEDNRKLAKLLNNCGYKIFEILNNGEIRPTLGSELKHKRNYVYSQIL